MHRIDHSTATVDNLFTEGAPSSGTPATVVTDDWLNDVQENIAAFIESQGITLVKGDYDQLTQAIALASYTSRFYTVLGDGTWNGTTLTMSTALEVVFRNEAGARRVNKIAAGALAIADGEVLVFRRDITSATPVTLTAETVYADLDVGQYMILAESSLTLDYVADEIILLRNRGGELEVCTNGTIYPSTATISFGSALDAASTGTGSFVRQTSPTINTPALTTPTITGNLNLHSGADLNVYSDAGSTLKASIDAATGDISTEGKVKFDANNYIDLLSTDTIGLFMAGDYAIQLDGVAGNVVFGTVDVVLQDGQKLHMDSAGGGNLNYFQYDSTLHTMIVNVDGAGAANFYDDGVLLPDTDPPVANRMTRHSGLKGGAVFVVTGSTSITESDSYNCTLSVTDYDVLIEWDTNFSDSDYYLVGSAHAASSEFLVQFGGLSASQAVAYCFSGGSAMTSGWYGSFIAAGRQ